MTTPSPAPLLDPLVLLPGRKETRPRFRVVSVTGGTIEQSGDRATNGTSYHVLDSLICYRIVATFDHTPGKQAGHRYRRKAKAERLADRLNRECGSPTESHEPADAITHDHNGYKLGCRCTRCRAAFTIYKQATRPSRAKGADGA